MSEIMPYIWIGVIVFAAVAEVYMFTLVTVWFIPSALAAFVLSLTGFPVWAQVLIFFIASFALLVLSRTFFAKFIKSGNANIISDSLTGKSGIVTQEINNYKNTGAVRIDGFEYKAISDDDEIIYETGLVVTIAETDGICVICSR